LFSPKEKELVTENDEPVDPKKWTRNDVIKYLQCKKKEIEINEDTIKIIKREKFSGLGFLALTKEDKLIQYCKMPFGAAITIVELAKELKELKNFFV